MDVKEYTGELFDSILNEYDGVWIKHFKHLSDILRIKGSYEEAKGVEYCIYALENHMNNRKAEKENKQVEYEADSND